MNITTKQWALSTVAERWKRQYPQSHQDIFQKLSALSAVADEDEITKIIGNSSWTRLQCDECGRDVDAYVTIGQEQDYDSSTARICRDCIAKALALFDAEALRLAGQEDGADAEQ